MPIDYNEFAEKIKAKYPEYKDLDNYTLASKMVEKYPEYKGQVDLKKKDPTAYGSGTSSSGRLSNTTTKPTASSSSTGEIFTGYPGKGDKPYQFKDDKWYEEAPVKVYGQKAQYVQIQDPNRIKNLNRQFGKDASLSQVEEVFSNYDEEKADNQYRIKDGQWQRMTPGSKWHTIQNEGSINALNKRYGKNVSTRVATTTTIKPVDFKDITADLVSKTEEKAIDYLKKNYSKYGFEFSEEGLFAYDQIKVRTKDGSKEEVFEFDEKNPKEADRLRSFLEQNASKQYSSTYNKLKALSDEGIEKYNVTNEYGSTDNPYKDKIKYTRGKNITSEEFINEFKKLNFEEQKDMIENVILKQMGDAGEKKFVAVDSKSMQKFYSSEAYKDYKQKKIKGDNQISSKLNTLYDEYNYAKSTKDPAKIRQAKNNIDSYITNDVIKDNVKNYDMQLNDLQSEALNIEKQRKFYEKEVANFNQATQNGSMTQQEYDQKKLELENMYETIQSNSQSLLTKRDEIIASKKKLNLVAGKYITAKEKEGGTAGFLLNKVLTGISSTLIEPLSTAGMGWEDRYDLLSPEEKKYYHSIEYNGKKLTKEQIENMLDNEATLKTRDDSKKAIINTLGSEGTTLEYMKSDDRGWFTQAIGGVLESLPAMATGALGRTISFTALASQAYSGIEEEMLRDPDFKYTSAAERSLIAIPYAAAMGALENIGLKNLVNAESFGGKVLMGIALKTAKKAGANTTFEALEKIATKEIESLVAKGAIKILQGGIAEFETGFTQSLVLDQGLKQVYNWIQESNLTEEQKKNLTQGEYFDTADNLAELGSRTFDDALAEMIGGHVMSTAGTLFSAVVDGNVSLYNAEDVEFLKEIAADSNFKKLYIAEMKSQMLTGNITKSKAQQNLDNLNEIQAAFEKMPSGLTVDQQKTALDLISERARLESEIKKLDPALAAAQTERVNAINDELKQLSYAVQEQTTSEVPIQSGTAVGGEVEERKPETGLKEITQKGKEEVDQYIANIGAEARVGNAINPVMEKMANAEYINDNEIDNAIEAIFNEVESLDKSDYSAETKAAVSEKLLNIAEKLDNYEFRTKTETVATTKAGAATTTRRTSEAVQKIRAEKYFDGVQATVNGQEVTLKDNNGRVEAQMPNGEVVVLDTPTMEITEDGFEFDDSDALVAVTVTDRLGNTARLTGDQALDFAIRDRENKLGVVEQAEFDTVYQEVEKKYIKEAPAAQVTAEETVAEEQQPIEEEVVVEEEKQPTAKPSETNLFTERNAKVIAVKFPKKKAIVRAALNIIKALPGVKIYLHENSDQYAQELSARTGETKQSIASEESAGSYINGEIHLDMSKADLVTLLHEAFHHAFLTLGVKNGMFMDLAKGLRPLIRDKARLAELDEFIQSYTEETDQETLELRAEEFAAQLGGILAANQEELTTTKLTEFKALINRIAKKIGLGMVFSAAANSKEAADFINAISRGLTTGENLMTMEPYTGGSAVQVKPNAKMKPKYKRVVKYDVDFTTELPTKTLKEVVEKYEGRVFVIQSDATGVGYDSNGDPIYGGIGYIAIKDNVDGKIGFASVDMKTARTTISKMINRYGPNEKVAVLVMAQNPSSTVGNYYGGKYFGRGLIELQKQSKTNYKAVAQSFIDFIESKRSVVDALNKNKTHQKLIDLIKNPGKYDEVGFAQEFVKDTTFDVRREILKTLLPEKSDIRTNKSTPYIKQSLKDLGFNRMDFLNEYGDNTLFTEEMYASDEGGLLAAGFEMTLPNQDGISDFVSGIENKGIKHHLFNGKLPYSDESFLLDGLYPMNENFSQFAKPQMVFNEEKLGAEKIQELVRKKYPEDKSYEDKFTNASSKNFVPRNNRTYTHLTSANKIKFKEELLATNPEYFKEQTPDVATDVARGMGFTPERGKRQEELLEKARTDGFSKRKKQIIGKNAYLSKNVKDNLSVAKKMEADKKSPIDIRIATGWEKGVDNKWRYEIEDVKINNKLKDLSKGVIQTKNTSTPIPLSQVISKSNALLTAYPKLADTIIIVTDVVANNKSILGAHGLIDGKDIILLKAIKDYDLMESTLVHEIQHAIQEIEGFAKGTNVAKTYKTKIALDRAVKLAAAEQKALDRNISFLSKGINTYDKLWAYFVDYVKGNLTAEENYDYVINKLGGESNLDLSNDYVIEYLKENSIPGIKDQKSLINMFEAKKLYDQVSGDLGYLSTAGEVESRNVEARRKMSAKERLNTLLSETENIPRSRQIIDGKIARKKQLIQRTDKASEKLQQLFQRENMPLTIQEAKEIVGEVIDWTTWYDGLSTYVDGIFGEYAEDVLSLLPLASMAADSAATVSLAINNAERIYQGEMPKGVAEFYGYISNFLQGKGIKSDKMSNFFKALTGDKDAIAVDSHVWSIIMWKNPKVNPKNQAEFEKAKEFVRTIADELGLAPREVQAALWAANILRTGERPDSYEEYFKKQLDAKGLKQRIETWRNKGYQPFSEIRKEREAGQTTGRKKQLVYNASPKSVEELGKRSGVVYFATDKREAEAYAESNRGQVREFEIPKDAISNEKVVLDKINELGLKPKDKQYTVEESNLYELIDDRFDNSLSQSDINKLFNALKKDGVTAFRYKDGAQVVEGTTESIAVIDTNVVQKSVRKKQISPKQKWVPTPVKNMNDSPIAKNSDKVRNAAVNLIKGLINVEDYRDIVNKFSPIKSIGTLFAPASTEHMELALGKKADKLMAPVVDENGEKLKKVGTRLDIPSYLHHNAWVVTVHDERVKNGPVVSYRNAVRLKNVEFSTDPRVALQIAAGYKTKSTFARMVGEMVDIPGSTAEEQGLNAQVMVEEIMNDPNWVQVGMNPFRHSFFWNRDTGMPVVSADEVIQIGGLVYAKNVKETSPNSEEFAVYGELDESGKKPSIKASDKPMLDKSGKTIKFQKAPKILGVKPTVVIVNDEQKALVDQIKLEIRAQREQKKAYKQVLASISARVTALKSKGNISVKQFDAIMKNLNRLNFDNETKVQAFIDYVSRALANADYVEKVSKAQSLNKKIKKSLKGTANPFAVVAKMFTTLDSRWVDNIDDHIAVAQMILDGVKPSTARRGVLTLKEEPDLQIIAEYIDKEQKAQTQMMLDRLRSRYEMITGKSAGSLDAEAMITQLDALKPDEDQTDKIKEQIDQKFAEYASMLSEEDPQVIVDAVNVDTDMITWRESVKILDALDTYFTNGSTAGIDSLMGSYQGIVNAKRFKYKSNPMTIALSKTLAKLKFENFTGFTRILERKFRSLEKSLAYEKASGINDIVTGVNRADFEAAKKQKEYVKKFEKVKDFNSNENIYERGVIADLIRTNAGIDQDAEFDRLVNILIDSKDMLLASQDQTKVEMGKLYDKVFKKLGLYEDGITIDDVLSKATKINVDAVEFVVDMFADKYDLLSDTALGVYNVMLGQDINYTPKTYMNIRNEQSVDSDPLSGKDSFSLGAYSNAGFNKNEAGVLMPITRPKDLKNAGKYVDLNFDNNMFRSYRLALTDAYTAKSIRQLNSFFNTKENEDILASEKDFDVIKAALSDYINTAKGKNFIGKITSQEVDKFLNLISTFGSVRALVGVGQALSQFASGMSNTIINAGEHIRPSDFTKKTFEFMNRSGQPIANVGENDILISLANFDKAIERATVGKNMAEIGLDKFAKFNSKAFQIFVSNPDAAARRLAWMAYYRKYISKNNLGPIDLNGEPNADAAAYAQGMVDRSMDATDARIRGDIYRTQNVWAKAVRGMLFPFSSFGMNQKTRMWGDLTKLVTFNADFDTARSLASIGAEMFVYNLIRYQMGRLILYAAMNMLGYDDEEQDELYEELKRNMISSSWNKAIVDTFSPLALFDNWTLELANWMMATTGVGEPSQKEADDFIKEENDIRKIKGLDPLTKEQEERKRDQYMTENSMQFYISNEANWGVLGIQFEKASESYEIYKAITTGKYTDEYGRDVYFDSEAREKLKWIALLKTGGQIVPLREIDQVANKSLKFLKKGNTMSEKKYDMITEVKRKFGKVDPVLEKLAEKKNKITTIENEIAWINKHGGLKGPKEKMEYAKLLDLISTPSKDMLEKIQRGGTAQEIFDQELKK